MHVYGSEFADALIISCAFICGVFEILRIGQIWHAFEIFDVLLNIFWCGEFIVRMDGYFGRVMCWYWQVVVNILITILTL